MTEHPEIAHLNDLPFDAEATLPGPIMRVQQLMALSPGDIIATNAPAGANIDIFVGGAYIGSGELGRSHGNTIVRMIRFKAKK